MRRLRRRTLSCVAALLALLAAAPAVPAQRPGQAAPGNFAFGTHVFRRLLFDLKLDPLKGFEQLGEDPADTLLVVLGDTSCLERGDAEWLGAFIEDGGAVLVATDLRTSTRGPVAKAAGVWVPGVSFVSLHGQAYRDQPFCPFLVRGKDASPDLFAGPRAEQVATNAPSCLFTLRRSLPGSLQPLAWLPAGSAPERGGRGIVIMVGGDQAVGPLFAVGGERGKGRVLVLADHSIFINQMMLPEDNGNLEFASNCLDYLRGERDARRHRVLFVEDGRARTDLEVPLKEGPLLPPGATRAIAAAADKALAGMEEHNAFNRGVWDWLGSSESALRLALGVGTVLLLAYLGYCLTVRARHRPELQVPLLARAVEGHTPAGTLLEQRGREAVGTGNLWEAARGLARDWLAGLPTAGEGPPRVEAGGSWWRRRVLMNRVRRLWRLAHEESPARVSPRGLRRLLRQVEALRDAQADGTLRVGQHKGTRGPAGRG
jgi:hypothetical protein